MHTSPWNTPISLTSWFAFQKYHSSLFNLATPQPVNLIYYDAFAPGAQPELWTVDAFTHLFGMLTAGGILVTYCSKSDVRRAMMAAGFVVNKIPGPHGKREMVRAVKPAAGHET
ncbi:MnmC family methyltransferase [Paraflavitalea speifideaquila]|uniref:MnmC family methyltransferase n=1 Tax=Paraflavitalea speifideaquila TaxID=3076558 RepID=UPI003312FCC6